MTARINTAWDDFWRLLGAFRAEQSGQIIIVFALASVAIFAGLGAGVDLATAYAARQRLSEVAALTCQYATRPSVAQTASSTYNGTNGFQTYVNNVNAFATASLTTQHWTNSTPTGPSGAANAYFTATPAAGGSTGSTYPTNPAVEMSASIPAAFGRILSITSIPVHTKINCQTLFIAPQIVNPPLMLNEGFEAPCVSYCMTQARGGTAYSNAPLNAFPNAPQYVGYGGFSWYIMGYCLETDTVGVINPTVPEATHAAELDCDNGSGSAGNSSISTKLYLAVGSYELRYFYRSRVDYPNYDPAFICGTTAGDVAFANDSNSVGGPRSNVVRTNQVNIYLDMNLTGSAPLHTTIDGTQQLAGANLIDVCVYSQSWVERSVRITVTTPAFYWLSFAADGANDSFGAQIDSIRFCQATCPNSVQDNFPTAWANSGAGKLLFEDTFDLPTYTATSSTAYLAKSGDPSKSTGTSGTATSGWPTQSSSGWLTAPYNQVDYGVSGAAQGSQYLELDGYNANGNAATNRVLSRPFLLDPGYYRVSYNYVPTVSFPGFVSGTYCTAGPPSGALYPNVLQTYVSGRIRNGGTIYTAVDTNLLGVFMSHGALVSTPNGGGAQGAATTYTNPDGSITTSPTVPPDTVSWQNYNAAQINPLIDTCGYADAWIARSVAVKVTKPGLYWLTFSSQNTTADGYGASIDDVKLTALGSPLMVSPPTSATPLVTIPVPAPQPDTTLQIGTYSGFSITADPLTSPAAAP